MTNYARGADFERKVQAHLESEGYVTVRSAGSKGAVDVVALKQGETLLVQVKRSNPRLSPADRSTLLRLAHLVGGVPVVAFQPGRGMPVEFRELTGPEPGEWVKYHTDQVIA